MATVAAVATHMADQHALEAEIAGIAAKTVQPHPGPWVLEEGNTAAPLGVKVHLQVIVAVEVAVALTAVVEAGVIHVIDQDLVRGNASL